MESIRSVSWIDAFLQQKSNRYFIRVDDGYLNDPFNHHGLSKVIHNYRQTLDIVRNSTVPMDTKTKQLKKELDPNAQLLYALIHARYLMTQPALVEMYHRFVNGDFERCPRHACHGTVGLPFGTSTIPKESTLSLYCPTCLEAYKIKDPDIARVDGAAFGSEWVFMFKSSYPQVFRKSRPQKTDFRLFGFRIEHSLSSSEEEEEDT